MHSLPAITALLAAATAVSASPTPKTEDIDAGVFDLETIYFKRDAVIEARDLAIAESNGVDISEMWKHSIVKRSDGNDITMWVHNSYVEIDPETDTGTSENLEARQVRTWEFTSSSGIDKCTSTTFEGRTNDDSPSTGAAKRVRDWARNNNGYFATNNVARGIRMIWGQAGNGRNAEFRARKVEADSWRPYIRVGTKNIADIVQICLDRYTQQANGGSYVVQARGMTLCESNGIGGFGWAGVSWALTRSAI